MKNTQLFKVLFTTGVFIVGALFILVSLDTPSTANATLVRATSTSDFVDHSEEELDFISQYRDSDVPDLPFDDNPDPTACGIPELWGPNNNIAYLNGIYDGEMIQEVVFLYDSHSRLEIVAGAPHGTQVEIIMYQNNPVMDYYKVRIPGAPNDEDEGWIPAALISREPLIDN